MINTLVSFPIWKNDGKEIVDLNDLQKKQIKNFLSKVNKDEYKFVDNPCLCGNTDKSLDILVAEKDRFGIPCDNVLCKKCGLVRLKERLDDNSTAEFYKNEYRDIYVGQELPSDSFFDEQKSRGKTFYSLFKQFINSKEINTVFEIGCGAGGILYPFYEDGKKVSGCDFGEKYLKFGQSKGLDLYQGEIDIDRTPRKSQDLVILSHVMEHFNEPIKTINEIIELISDEKYLLVEVPGFFYITTTYVNPILYFQNAHVHNYYYYYLKVFFETLGLKVIYGDERCTFLLQKPRSWAKKLEVVIYHPELKKWAHKIENKLLDYANNFNKLNIAQNLKNKNFEFSKDLNTLFKQINELKKLNKKYYIYGAGNIGQIISSLMPNQILGFIDNDILKIGTLVFDIKIYPPEELMYNNHDSEILISVLGREYDISRFLIENLNIESSRIKFFDINNNQTKQSIYEAHFKYQDLLNKNIDLKEIHKGKRCFILGSGPSILKEDLKPLRNEIVFALNNFYVHEDFQEIMSGDITKYYMTAPVHPPQSEEEWEKWFKDMETHIPKNINMIFGLNSYNDNIKYIIDKYKLFKEYSIFWYFADKNFEYDKFDSDGLDLTKSIYSAEAVSIYALIVAIYMGFEEVYLLGMDHDYFLYNNENDMRMYKQALHQTNELERTFGNSFYTEELLRQYKIFKKYEAIKEKNYCKIFNASNGGILRIFDKIELKTILSET